MMTSSNGNIFRVTGHLCGECTSPRWIPRTKASDAELQTTVYCNTGSLIEHTSRIYAGIIINFQYSAFGPNQRSSGRHIIQYNIGQENKKKAVMWIVIGGSLTNIIQHIHLYHKEAWTIQLTRWAKGWWYRNSRRSGMEISTPCM